jgi:signal transduction histidine kinase
MIVVLLASGAFVYWRVAFALDRRLDSDLADDATTVAALLRPDGTVRDPSALGTSPALSDFQVLRGDNTVVSSGPGLGPTSLLTLTQLGATRSGVTTVEVGTMVPISARPLRLRAQPWGEGLVLVVGVRRDARDEALRELVVQLALAGLGTLLITTVVGERLAKAALRPVERYRARAALISGGAAGLRLDVPEERDDEVTRLGHTLNTMLDALDHALTRERRFVHDASHELRTPLTLLQARTQLALSRPRTTAEHEETLRELQTDIAELAGLAGQLLELGTATDAPPADQHASRPAGDPGAVLTALHAQTAAHRAAALPAAWTLDVPTPSPRVGVPDTRLRQILTNLLSNAALHGRPPVHVAVRVADHHDPTVAVLTVSDAGTDLRADFLPHAAERFHRSDQARARPGAGLGLSLVHSLVDQYLGELRLCADGHHHRYQQRFAVPCTHPSAGTTVSVLLGALEDPEGSPEAGNDLRLEPGRSPQS